MQTEPSTLSTPNPGALGGNGTPHRADALLAAQNQVLEMVVRGAPLLDVLTRLALIAQEQASRPTICSIMLTDPTGQRLHNGAAPSLPKAYLDALEGLAVDASVGTCCASAAIRKVVVTPDIENAASWGGLAHLPLQLGLRSAWSMPILSSGGKVLGTIGCYSTALGEPQDRDMQIVEGLSRTAALAIERGQAESALRESEERLRLGLDAGNTGTWDWNIVTGHVAWSDRVYEFHGVKPGEFGGSVEEFARLVHPEDRDYVERSIQESIAEHKPYVVEFRVVHPDGKTRWIATRGNVHYDAAGKPLRMLGATSDVTERKENEAAQRRSAEVSGALDKVAAALTGELDVHKIVQTITDAGQQLTGAAFGAFFYNVLNDRGESYTLYTLSGVPRSEFDKFPMPRATAMFGPTFRGEGVIRLHDVLKDPRYGKNAPHYGMPKGHLPVRSYLAVPVKSRSGEVLGGLFFGHPEPGVFDERAESLATGLAAQAGVVVDNARLYKSAQDSEARFRQLANSIPQLAWMAEPDGSIFWYNQRWYEYTGTTLEDMAGWGWQKVHDLQTLPAVLERWKHSLTSGEPFDMTFPLRGADGTFRQFLTRVLPLRDEQGNIVLWFGTNTDISEQTRQEEALKVSEARLRAVVEATPECVKIVSPEGGLSYMNHAGLCMIETESAEAVSGASVLDLIAPAYRSEWRANHRRVCEGEKLSWEFEIVGLRGTRRWMETNAVPLPLPDGRNAQLAVTRDITLRKHAETEREALLQSERAARSEAERVSQMKDEFLATLSHELRTPLNAILGWSQILSGQHTPDDLQQGLSTIERNARVQTQIIEDLLDMSRIISGKIRLDVQKIDLPAIVEASLQTVRPAAEAKGIRLQPIVDPLAGPVTGDPNRLQQVLWNLLSNAIKFTPRGGRVQVLLQRVNSHIELSVSDTGEGIRAEFLPYVFDRFRQADASTTRRFGGLGLGLAIVKQLVELHGGHVRATSGGAGQGATFTLSLPLMAIHQGPEETAPRVHPRASSTMTTVEQCKSIEGVRVLVVDDEADARSLVERLLHECGAIVATASSAQEAIDRLQREPFDVLVSDVGMPGEDGHSLIRRIRKLEAPIAGIPALALTAYARSEDRQRAIIAGYHLHVAKPVEAAELITMVASLAERNGR